MSSSAYAATKLADRDHYTDLITETGEKAAAENRDLTDTEIELIQGWQERCAKLDAELDRSREIMESNQKYAALRQRHQELENGGRLETRSTRSTVVTVPSWGSTFVESDQFQNWHGGRGAPVTMPFGLLERAAQVAPTGTARAASDPITTGDILDNAYEYVPRQPVWRNPLLDAISREPVNSGAVEWIRFQPTVPAAAPQVAEGALKPPLDFTLVEKSVTLNTYAVWKAITRQALEDMGRIRAIIEGYLRQSLLEALAAAVATAITTDATIPSVGVATSPLLASIRAAMAQVEANGFTPNTVIVNSSDWAAMDVASAILASALPGVQRGFWGLTVIGSKNVAAGTAYVGDLAAGVTLFDRNATSVFISDSHADNFLRNILVILAETRAYAAVVNPGAMCKAVGNGSLCIECTDGSVTVPSLGDLLTGQTETTTTVTTTTTTEPGAPPVR